MTDQELTQLLNRVKDAPELGGQFNVDGGWKALASDLGFEQKEMKPYGIRDYAKHALWLIGNRMARPMAVGFTSFALIFGGWVATVNASFDSVPGDKLYSVKIVTERVQLSVASRDRRAKLHTQFAARRLEEVSTINRSDRDEKNARVKVAVEGLKKELASARENLAGIHNPVDAAAVAVVLNEQATEAEAVLGEEVAADEDVQGAVDEAISEAEGAGADAVEALVTTHETADEELTAFQLEKEFQNQVQDLKDRIAYALGRLAMIDELEASADHAESLSEVRKALVGHDNMIAEAMNALVFGGYRTGFNTLDKLKNNVKIAEDLLAQVEIALTTPQE